MANVDILLSVALLLWFVIALVMVYAALFLERKLWSKTSTAFSIFLVVSLLTLILNNYLGNRTIEGVVYAVSKTASDGTTKIEVSKSVSAQFEPSKDILKPYEVAIYPDGSNKLQILSNDNNLWRFKFSKREIQLQLEPGKKYRFIVHRLFWGRNILDIEAL